MNKTKTLLYSIAALLMLTSCTKDEPKTDPNTVKDIDGNIYHTVTIGTQTWLVENLKTTKYRNGDLIGTTTPSTKKIYSESTPKYQWAYAGNEANVTKYGRLYTWYTVTDNRNITPIGWHVPTHAEWTTLINYVTANVGTSISIVKALASTTDWVPSTIIGETGNNPLINNYSGFNAFPGGYRSVLSADTYYYFGNYTSWWSSDEFDASYAWYNGISSSSSVMYRFYHYKGTGFSVRCLKD